MLHFPPPDLVYLSLVRVILSSFTSSGFQRGSSLQRRAVCISILRYPQIFRVCGILSASHFAVMGCLFIGTRPDGWMRQHRREIGGLTVLHVAATGPAGDTLKTQSRGASSSLRRPTTRGGKDKREERGERSIE